MTENEDGVLVVDDSVQKFPGFQAVATARNEDVVFTVNVLPGSDMFRRKA
jgi:hypothetical protein